MEEYMWTARRFVCIFCWCATTTPFLSHTTQPFHFRLLRRRFNPINVLNTHDSPKSQLNDDAMFICVEGLCVKFSKTKLLQLWCRSKETALRLSASIKKTHFHKMLGGCCLCTMRRFMEETHFRIAFALYLNQTRCWWCVVDIVQELDVRDAHTI